MRFPIPLILPAVLAAGLLAASTASADVNPVHYLDATAFHALGSIDQVTNFDAFAEGDITYVGDPYTDGLLTITSTQNSVFGKNYPTYEPVRNALANNYQDPLHVAVDGTGYNLFSFQIGDLVGSESVTLWIYTDQDSFGYGLATLPTNEGFKFHGFLAPDGQYFTGFNFTANDDVTVPAFSEFELGHTNIPCNSRTCIGGAVPEPDTWAMLILGFGAAGIVLRRRQSSVPASA